MKKSAAEAHRMLSDTYDETAISERTVVSGLNVSRTMILTSKTGMAVEERRFSKMQNWRHYFMKIHVKRKKNWQDYWSDSTRHFKMPATHGNDSETRKLGAV